MRGLSQQPQIDDMTPTLCVYDNFDAIADLQEEWNDLARRAGDILSSYDWCEVWWKHFGAGRSLEIHTLHEGQRLVAVLPLFRETVYPGGIQLRTVRVVGCDYTATAVGLAIEPPYAERFARLLLDHLDQRGPWDMLEMAPLRSYASVAEPIAQTFARDSRVHAVLVGRQDGWDTLFDLPSTYERFLASLPAGSRNDTPRRERRLREFVPVEIAAVTSPEQVQPAMDDLIRLHQAYWMNKGRPGHFRRWSVQQFHRELAQRLVDKGELSLLTLKAKGQTVAATYGYSFAGRTHNLIVGNAREGSWQRYGLGKIMYSHLVRHAMSRGSTVLEDGRGIFGHKLDLGGKLHGGRSLVAIHCGLGARLRFWAGMRAAYLEHILYSRIWLDKIAPSLGIVPMERPFFVRHHVLAQLFRRTRFRLFGGPILQEIRCLEPYPAGHVISPGSGSPEGQHSCPSPAPGNRCTRFLRRVLALKWWLTPAIIYDCLMS
jgi:CelD/BcsL family acetyltransferase involved in cellulose biosynthesis